MEVIFSFQLCSVRDYLYVSNVRVSVCVRVCESVRTCEQESESVCVCVRA
jgi:hypothetical protein